MFRSVFLAFVLLCVLLASLAIGRYPLSFNELIQALSFADPDSMATTIVWQLRLPRVLLVMLCGMSLALAGAAMQGVFRNPLVGPELCGASAGASLGGVLAILLGLSTLGMTVLAFLLAFAALTCAFLLAQIVRGANMLALVLAGIIVSTFFGALVGLLQTLADPQTQLPAMIFWLLGSFADANYSKVATVALVMLLAGGALIGLRWRLNLLSLGESDARTLGVPVTALRWLIVIMVAALVAAQVSVSGGIGWVGLVVPHMARFLVGASHTRLLPASALAGGLFLLLIDDLARAASDQELPIGLLTAIIGAPVFAVLFWKTQETGDGCSH